MNPLIIRTPLRKRLEIKTNSTIVLDRYGVYRGDDMTLDGIGIDSAQEILTENASDKIRVTIRDRQTREIRYRADSDTYPVVRCNSAQHLEYIGVAEIEYDGTQPIRLDLTKNIF